MGEECAIPDCPHKKLWEVATDVFKEERDKWVIEKRGLERRLKEALTAPQPHVGVEVTVEELESVIDGAWDNDGNCDIYELKRRLVGYKITAQKKG